jgi:hypothetical protein
MKLGFYLDGDCVKLNNNVKTKTKEDIHARTLTNLRTRRVFNVCVCKTEFDLFN